jgi:type II secretory pathway component PulJ
LIEIVIAVAIFSLLSTVVGGIYVAFSQSQARTQAGQKLLGEMQFSLESIAREIRNGEIDYNVDCDNDFSAPTCLVLERSDNTKIAFVFGNDKVNLLCL